MLSNLLFEASLCVCSALLRKGKPVVILQLFRKTNSVSVSKFLVGFVLIISFYLFVDVFGFHLFGGF